MMQIFSDTLTASDKKGGDKPNYNPFEGVTPNFGPFEEIFASRLSTLLAFVWLLALAYLGFRLVVSLVALGKAKRGKYGADLDEAKQDLGWTAATVVAVAAVGPIYGALVVF